jgi:tetratricopeptide (TPR) repeat protein
MKMVKKEVFVYLLTFLLAFLTASVSSCAKPARQGTAPEITVFTVDLDSAVTLGTPISFAPDNSLYSELQWLAVQTACIGIYNNAQAGNYTLGDPQDHYKPADIRDFLTERSGAQTRTDMFYGICFDYAQAAYDDIVRYAGHYGSLGLGEWYIAGVFDDPGEIVLYDPASRAEADMVLNGVYVKEHSRRRVRSHGNATWHAWLWALGKDGTVYWIDPTWTDNSGYVWWGVVRDGEEVQLNPLQSLCVLDINPADPSFAWNNRGNGRKNNEEYDQAIADYIEALRLNPSNAFAYLGRGTAYVEKGDYDLAIADLNQAISLGPNLVNAYNNRGTAYSGKGDYDRAIADYNQAISLDPNYAIPYVGRGIAYCYKNDYNRAIADLNQAISLDPNLAAAYVSRGAAYNEKGMSDRAIADLNQAISLDPNLAAAYSNRGTAYNKKGMYDRAIADYNQAISLDPNDAIDYYNRGEAYYYKNDYNRAIADFEAALRINPNFAYARASLEVARQARGW